MGAGLSHKQFYGRVYRRLQAIRRDLRKVGVESVYKNCTLVWAESLGGPVSGGFNISFRRLNASNGECAGLPSVYISAFGIENKRYDWLEFKQGIRRVKEIFGRKPINA